MMPGGLTEAKLATPEIQEIAELVRVGHNSYSHMKIVKPLPQQRQSLTLTGYQTDESKADEQPGF
uniref:Uncharacterized protein n=1 Tax=Rhinolophus ferrumequinum TaxID=59479 RepID=A0A671F7H3_RHIFE